jgi:hypothetical protein
MCVPYPPPWTEHAHDYLRRHHRSLHKHTRMPAHKLRNASTVNTNRASIGVHRDRHYKMETHLPPPTQFTSKSRLVNQLVRQRVQLVVTSVDNLSHRRASGQVNSSCLLPIYVHATLPMASPVRIPMLLRLLQLHTGVPMATASQETLRIVQRAHSQVVRLVHSR